MLDPLNPLVQLLQNDRRYHAEAYFFVLDALQYAQEKLNMGKEAVSAPLDSKLRQTPDEEGEGPEDDETGSDPPGSERGRHVSGQDLCEAIRRYALDQYGMLALQVLNHWGVRKTGDFGNIVFNLIEIGKMRKTEEDCLEDFSDVFDFEEGLLKRFRFKKPRVETTAEDR